MSAPLPAPGLLRILRFWEGAAVSIGVAIGAGILRTPGDVARFLPSAPWLLGVWTLGGLIALLDALVLAELAAMRPRAGGHYVYLTAAYGPRLGFLYGWSAAFLTWPASIAGLAAVASEFAGRLGLPGRPLGLLIILVPACVHATGLRTGALAQDCLSYGKALGLALLALGAALLAPRPAGATEAAPHPIAVAAVVFALQRVLWTYDGYSDAIFLAEETRDPGRDVPRALLAAVGLLALVYVALNGAFLLSLSPGEMAASNLVAAEAAGRFGGRAAVHAIEALALLTVLGGSSAQLLSGPRISFAMARDGLLFGSFRRVTRHGTPIVALLVMTAFALAYYALNTFDQIVEMTIFVIVIFVSLNTAALFVFRRREPERHRPFRVPLYPLPPALLLAVTLTFLALSAREALRSGVWLNSVTEGLLVVAAGLVAYEVWRRLRRGRSSVC